MVPTITNAHDSENHPSPLHSPLISFSPYSRSHSHSQLPLAGLDLAHYHRVQQSLEYVASAPYISPGKATEDAVSNHDAIDTTHERKGSQADLGIQRATTLPLIGDESDDGASEEEECTPSPVPFVRYALTTGGEPFALAQAHAAQNQVSDLLPPIPFQPMGHDGFGSAPGLFTSSHPVRQPSFTHVVASNLSPTAQDFVPRRFPTTSSLTSALAAAVPPTSCLAFSPAPPSFQNGLDGLHHQRQTVDLKQPHQSQQRTLSQRQHEHLPALSACNAPHAHAAPRSVSPISAISLAKQNVNFLPYERNYLASAVVLHPRDPSHPSHVSGSSGQLYYWRSDTSHLNNLARVAVNHIGGDSRHTHIHATGHNGTIQPMMLLQRHKFHEHPIHPLMPAGNEHSSATGLSFEETLRSSVREAGPETSADGGVTYYSQEHEDNNRLVGVCLDAHIDDDESEEGSDSEDDVEEMTLGGNGTTIAANAGNRVATVLEDLTTTTDRLLSPLQLSSIVDETLLPVHQRQLSDLSAHVTDSDSDDDPESDIPLSQLRARHATSSIRSRQLPSAAVTGIKLNVQPAVSEVQSVQGNATRALPNHGAETSSRRGHSFTNLIVDTEEAAHEVPDDEIMSPDLEKQLGIRGAEDELVDGENREMRAASVATALVSPFAQHGNTVFDITSTQASNCTAPTSNYNKRKLSFDSEYQPDAKRHHQRGSRRATLPISGKTSNSTRARVASSGHVYANDITTSKPSRQMKKTYKVRSSSPSTNASPASSVGSLYVDPKTDPVPLIAQEHPNQDEEGEDEISNSAATDLDGQDDGEDEAEADSPSSTDRAPQQPSRRQSKSAVEAKIKDFEVYLSNPQTCKGPRFDYKLALTLLDKANRKWIRWDKAGKRMLILNVEEVDIVCRPCKLRSLVADMQFRKLPMMLDTKDGETSVHSFLRQLSNHKIVRQTDKTTGGLWISRPDLRRDNHPLWDSVRAMQVALGKRENEPVAKTKLDIRHWRSRATELERVVEQQTGTIEILLETLTMAKKGGLAAVIRYLQDNKRSDLADLFPALGQISSKEDGGDDPKAHHDGESWDALASGPPSIHQTANDHKAVDGSTTSVVTPAGADADAHGDASRMSTGPKRASISSSTGNDVVPASIPLEEVDQSDVMPKTGSGPSTLETTSPPRSARQLLLATHAATRDRGKGSKIGSGNAKRARGRAGKGKQTLKGPSGGQASLPISNEAPLGAPRMEDASASTPAVGSMSTMASAI